jgi:hypothetical protein
MPAAEGCNLGWSSLSLNCLELAALKRSRAGCSEMVAGELAGLICPVMLSGVADELHGVTLDCVAGICFNLPQ